MDTKKQVKDLIEAYEKDQKTIEETISGIQSLTGKEVTAYTLDNYWRGIDLEELVEELTIKEIEDWEALEEETSKELVIEIINKITESAIVERNARALEKRYRKTTGTVVDWVFFENEVV